MRFPNYYESSTGTLKLGSFAGAPVLLHWGIVVPAALLTSSYWLRGRLLLGLLAALMLFGSILVHELAHAWFARRFAVPIQDIVIHMLGGFVRFRARPRHRAEDYIITLAGPVSNLVLAALVYRVLWLIPPPEPQPIAVWNQYVQGPPLPGLVGRALPFALYLNLGLAIVNMIPGFPLDGGRIVFLIIEQRRGGRTASVVVGVLGMIFASLNLIVFVASALAGFPVLAPPSFMQNWQVVDDARGGKAYAF
jgi:Zn-dependent protease